MVSNLEEPSLEEDDYGGQARARDHPGADVPLLGVSK